MMLEGKMLDWSDCGSEHGIGPSRLGWLEELKGEHGIYRNKSIGAISFDSKL